MQDKIVITDKSLLPVTGFTYGPFTTQNSQASVEIKSLECEHRPIIITRNDCDAIKFLNRRRLQFDMEYVNNKDCYGMDKLYNNIDLGCFSWLIKIITNPLLVAKTYSRDQERYFSLSREK